MKRSLIRIDLSLGIDVSQSAVCVSCFECPFVMTDCMENLIASTFSHGVKCEWAGRLKSLLMCVVVVI